MTPQIGNDLATPEALAQMRNFRCKECEACKVVEASKSLLAPNPPFDHANDATVECWNKVLADNPCDVKWAAFQNHDLGHPDLGHLRFLAIGPGCTFKTPPARMPDTKEVIGWRYILVGKVNLKTGAIEEEKTCSCGGRIIRRGDGSEVCLNCDGN
jgi:hypothetical protein